MRRIVSECAAQKGIYSKDIYVLPEGLMPEVVGGHMHTEIIRDEKMIYTRRI